MFKIVHNIMLLNIGKYLQMFYGNKFMNRLKI